jgi:hypothetical protein
VLTSNESRDELSDGVRRAYDGTGVFGRFILVYFGGNLLRWPMFPVKGVFNSFPMSF